MTSKQKAHTITLVWIWLLLAWVAVWHETGSFTGAAVVMLLADLMWRRVVDPIVFRTGDVLEPAPKKDRTDAVR